MLLRCLPVLLALSLAECGLAADAAVKKPLVVAHYYTWYTTPWGAGGQWGHWVHGGKSSLLDRPNNPDIVLFPPAIREISSTAYPFAGPYDSMSREIVRWHIRLAKAAGIDAFLVDWWGPATWQKPAGWTHDVFVKTVLPVAEEEGFKVALFDESPQFVDSLDDVREWTARYLKQFKDSPAWLKIDGKPVWAVYQLWEGKLSAAQGRELVEYVEKQAGPVFWIMDRMRLRNTEEGFELFTPGEWLSIPQIGAIMGYSMFGIHRVYEYKDVAPLYSKYVPAIHAAGKKVLLPVHPGHDNRKIAEEPWVMPRRSGQTLKDFWKAAVDSGADIIGITSFNEWPESTVVEPALTWRDPYQYLRIIAEFQGREFVPPKLPPADAMDPAIREYAGEKPQR